MASPEAERRECGNCIYFDDQTGKFQGLCCINPPVASTVPGGCGQWPRVYAAQWCGKHSSRPVLHLTPESAL